MNSSENRMVDSNPYRPDWDLEEILHQARCEKLYKFFHHLLFRIQRHDIGFYCCPVFCLFNSFRPHPRFCLRFRSPSQPTVTSVPSVTLMTNSIFFILFAWSCCWFDKIIWFILSFTVPSVLWCWIEEEIQLWNRFEEKSCFWFRTLFSPPSARLAPVQWPYWSVPGLRGC